MLAHLTARQRSLLWMLLNVLCWGLALPIVKPALEITTPFRYLLYRYIFASIFSLPLLWHYLPVINKKKEILIKVGILEVLGTIVALSFLYAGLELTSSLQASLLASTTPIFLTIGGILFLREREQKKEWMGLLLAFLGTLLLIAEPVFFGAETQISGTFRGNSLIILQNVSITAYYLLAKVWYTKYPKFLVTSLSFLIGLVGFLALSWWEVGHDTQVLLEIMKVELTSPAVLMAAIYMATAGSIIGLTAYIKGQNGMEASEAGLFTYLQPVVALPLSIFWLNESISAMAVTAMALIAIGVYVGQPVRPTRLHYKSKIQVNSYKRKPRLRRKANQAP